MPKKLGPVKVPWGKCSWGETLHEGCALWWRVALAWLPGTEEQELNPKAGPVPGTSTGLL